MGKRALVQRFGAYGDCVIITPVIDELYDQGYEVILETSDRGLEIFKHDERINEMIMHDPDMPVENLSKNKEELKKKYKPDKVLDFCGSIEQNLALHPVQPLYVYPKHERIKRCNKNYYRITKEWSGLTSASLKPSLRFTKEEEEKVQKYLKKGRFNIQWNLSGSGRNKMYPWTEYVMTDLIQDFPDIHFITTGNEDCQLLENIVKQMPEENFTELAGRVGIRESLLLTKYTDLLISPDTGVLHASGCFDTPKIGLLGHTTKENITKYFENDFSLESDAACSPCMYLIYDHKIQCPLHPITAAPWCMTEGIVPERVKDQILKVKELFYDKRDEN